MAGNQGISFKRNWMAPVAAAAVMALTGAASAQQQPQGPQVESGQWVKACAEGGCVVVQNIAAETGQPISQVQIREAENNGPKSLVVAVRPGMMLQPGMRAAIDGGRQYEIPYGICFPNACYGEIEINAEFISAMKAGGELTITTMTQGGKPATFPHTLVGFTAAYDGEGIKPQQSSNAQPDRPTNGELSKALQEKAERARQNNE